MFLAGSDKEPGQVELKSAQLIRRAFRREVSSSPG